MRPVGLPDCPFVNGIADCNPSAMPLLLVLRDKTYSKSQRVTKFTFVHACLRQKANRQAIRQP
jgi:hypothetical protein